MWHIYALYNKQVNKIYIGQTNNLDRRVREHNEKRGQHFTSKFDGTWELIYKETAQNRKEALIREKQLKSHKGRDFIKKYIKKH